MVYEYTKSYIFERLSKRVKKQLKKRNTSIYKEFYSDESMMYKVIKCEYNKKRNPYLINDHIIEILISKKIFNNKKQLLWGDDIDNENVLYNYFYYILFDMLISDKYNNFLNKILIDYSEYSLYRTLSINIQNPILKNVITNNLNINEQKLFDKYMTSISNAINYLYYYRGISNKFKILFLSFINKIDSFSKLDTKIDKILINEKLKTLLLQYIAKEDSLGYRVESIIKNDIKVIAFDNILPKKIEHPMRMLPIYSIEYINKLISIQKRMIKSKDIIIYQLRKYTKGSKKSDFI